MISREHSDQPGEIDATKPAPVMSNDLELITTDAPELARVVTAAALEPTTGEKLIRGFAPFFKDAKSILDVSRTITVTDATQVSEIRASRENRLKLRAVRIAADKVRKELKEDSQRLGNGIQSVYNLLVLDIEKEEKRLQEAEDFAARAEAARREKLKAERTAELVNADPSADLTCYDLAAMSDSSFLSLLESTKLVVAARKAAAEKAEAERVEAARLAAEEAARKEAERLAQVAEAKRLAAEAAEQARIANEAREKAEAEARAAAEAAAKEAARIAAEVAEREAAAVAERKRIEDEAAAKLAAERAESERLRKEAEAAAAAELARLAAIAAAEKAEAERIVKEAAAKAKAEADARELEQKKAREAAEAEAARHKAEADRLAKIEAARIAAEEKAKRDAAAAPDKEKLAALVAAIRALPVPALETSPGLAQVISEQREKFAAWVATQSAKL